MDLTEAADVIAHPGWTRDTMKDDAGALHRNGTCEDAR